MSLPLLSFDWLRESNVKLIQKGIKLDHLRTAHSNCKPSEITTGVQLFHTNNLLLGAEADEVDASLAFSLSLFLPDL